MYQMKIAVLFNVCTAPMQACPDKKKNLNTTQVKIAVEPS